MKQMRSFKPGMLIYFLVILCFSWILSGCTIAKISGSSPVPVYMNNAPGQISQVIHVQTKKFRAFDYTGSFDVAEALQKKYDKEYSEGKEMFHAITNVKVIVKKTPGNWLLNLITLGFANSRTIKVEADLVWFK